MNSRSSRNSNSQNSNSRSKNHSHISSHISSNSNNNSNKTSDSDNNSTSKSISRNVASKKQAIGVAILDTGIYRHIDFENRIIAFVDFVNGQMMPYDDNGHGSHVGY